MAKAQFLEEMKQAFTPGRRHLAEERREKKLAMAASTGFAARNAAAEAKKQRLRELAEEALAKKTLPRPERAPKEVGMPAWEDVPTCEPDPERPGRFLYSPRAWGTRAATQRPASPARGRSQHSAAPSDPQL